MTENENQDNITRLFENLKIREKKRRKKKWYNRKLAKLTFTQWMLIALVIINLTILILHIYNTYHVQEMLMYQQIEDEALQKKGGHHGPPISP